MGEGGRCGLRNGAGVGGKGVVGFKNDGTKRELMSEGWRGWVFTSTRNFLINKYRKKKNIPIPF